MGDDSGLPTGVIGFYPLILSGLVLDYSYTTHTYTGRRRRIPTLTDLEITD